MNTELLKKKILDLAIQGKLVEQRADEGTAEELYQQIQEEKQKLIKEGKIKKEKTLPEITEDEIPFEIPKSWKWGRITEIALNIFAGGDKPNNLTSNITETNKVPVVANGLVNEGIIGYTDSYSVEKGCITVSGRGTIGFPVIRTYNFFPIVRLIVINPSKLLFDKYLYYYLSSQKYDSTGTSIPQLTVPMIKPKIIPLPPLEEQKRIVTKIENLFSKIDLIEKAKIELRSNASLLEKKILDLAIQGKLVEQRADEGTAEELYQQIQKEKQNLIKEGKIKKEKPLPAITDDEIPFEIPDTWMWVKMSEISLLSGGFSFKSSNYSTEGIRVLRISDFNQSGIIEKDIVRHKFVQELSSYKLMEKDIVMCMTGGTVGKNCYISVLNEDTYTNQRVCTIRCFATFNSKFLYYVINSCYIQLKINSIKNSTNDNISMDAIRNFIIPLPPLAEQKRIVAKIEELMVLSNQLK